MNNFVYWMKGAVKAPAGTTLNTYEWFARYKWEYGYDGELYVLVAREYGVTPEEVQPGDRIWFAAELGPRRYDFFGPGTIVRADELATISGVWELRYTCSEKPSPLKEVDPVMDWCTEQGDLKHLGLYKIGVAQHPGEEIDIE